MAVLEQVRVTHRAQVTWPDGETFYAASVDGELFLKINKPAEAEDGPRIAQIIAGENGTRPILMTRRYLEMGTDARPAWTIEAL